METTIKIEGMSCNHCAMRVKKALEALRGVAIAEVSVENKLAKVTLSEEVSPEVLRNAIENAGYIVIH